MLSKRSFREISARPPPTSRGKSGGATLSRLAPTSSARQGEGFTPRSVKSSG
jgi:hypothetical protein